MSEKSDERFDFIVVGGGLSGNVVASRLSEDPSVSVLLLEAGGIPNTATRTPLIWITWPGTTVDWDYRSTPQKYAATALNNQQVPLTAGKLLGGGSGINAVMWVRGTRNDFNDWVKAGATGWSYEENLPYFIRSENCQIERFMNSSLRGIGGPISVNEGGFQTGMGESVIKAAGSFGYRTEYDYNGHERLGFSRVQSDVSNGLRVDSARAYIDPVMDSRDNLVVIIHAHVTRIIFDENKYAIGVEYYNLLTNSRIPETVFANREVILAAGAIGTPKILMLSGIGHSHHLMEFGIPVIQDLPVGNNLQDHYGTYGLNWQIDQSLIQTWIQGSVSEILTAGTTRGRAGIAALVDYTGFINTVAGASDPTDTPDVQVVSLAGLSLVSDMGIIAKQAFNIRDDVWQQTFADRLRTAFTSEGVFILLLHPWSRGVVRLASKNPLDPPLVDPDYFQDQRDVETIVRGMRFMMDLVNSLKSYNPVFLNVSVPGCPFPADVRSDGYLECIARAFTQTIYHYSGTCRMGSRNDPASVVDPELRVIGVHGLRIVDTSVFPSLPSGNTQATAYMVAEKAADIIRENRRL